jgi:transcription termination factor NusB
VLGTAADVASLDALIQQHSEHWRLGRLAVIDRLILRSAPGSCSTPATRRTP